jgi:hypothetical protein
MTPTLTIDGLEQVYDQLAQAIDRAGKQHTELFLVKLALLSAKQLGDAAVFGELIETALLDLENAGSSQIEIAIER